MHDFCFTIPYGLILIVGGLIGYATKGSLASLGGGAGAGLLLILAGTLSLKAFQKRKNSYFALILETVTAVGLTYVMGQRYMQTSKIMPAGLISGIRSLHQIASMFLPFFLILSYLIVLMTMFYAYKVVCGGNHLPPAKTE